MAKGAPLDCSGFTQAVILAAGGPDIGAGTWGQREWCKAHGKQLWGLLTLGGGSQAGDLLFWMNQTEADPGGPGTPSHVGIATGEGTVLEETLSFYANVAETLVKPRWTASYVEAWRIAEWSA